MIFRFIGTLRNYFRASFFAGMLIAVPFGATVAVLVWLWGKINTPLKQIFSAALTTEEMPWSEIGTAVQNSQYDRMLIPIISAALVLMAVMLLGMLTRSIVGRVVLGWFESALSRMPLVGVIYSSIRQFGEAFATSDGESKFQRVVAVQFPYKGSWSIGFVTGKAVAFLPQLAEQNSMSELLSVVVPSTPFPTTSFMIVVPENETITLDIPVKQALKLVISGGIISPGDSQRFMPSALERALHSTAAIKGAP